MEVQMEPHLRGSVETCITIRIVILRIAEQLAQMTFAASVLGTFARLLQDLSDS